MKELWFLKWPIVIFLIGVITWLMGALFKIRHWPMADEMITISSFICGLAIVFAIIKIALVKKPRP